MLIELETLSSDGGENLDFACGATTSTPVARPTFLPLREKSCFHPSLPSTPEIIIRERSYCSLPSRPVAKSSTAESSVTSAASESETRDEPNVKRDFCCPWFIPKWLRYLWKPSRPQSLDNIKIRTNSPKKRGNEKQVLFTTITRRRAATVQPSSLFGQVCKLKTTEKGFFSVVYFICRLVFFPKAQNLAPKSDSTLFAMWLLKLKCNWTCVQKHQVHSKMFVFAGYMHTCPQKASVFSRFASFFLYYSNFSQNSQLWLLCLGSGNISNIYETC